MQSTATQTPAARRPGYLAFAWPRIAVCALVGFVAAALLALLSPSGWEAEVDVLVTRLAVEDQASPVDGGSPREAEIRFANSTRVRDAARGVDPTAADTIEVELDPDTNVMTFRAPGETANNAQRLAGGWATAYINERRLVLRDVWTTRTQLIQLELDDLVDDLGRARLDGNDVEAERLEIRRDLALVEQADAVAALDALGRDPGAEIFGQGRPATRTGAGFGITTLAGPIIGALLGALWAWARWRTPRAQLVEGEGWLERANEGSLAPVLTTRALTVPSFLDEPATTASADRRPWQEVPSREARSVLTNTSGTLPVIERPPTDDAFDAPLLAESAASRTQHDGQSTAVPTSIEPSPNEPSSIAPPMSEATPAMPPLPPRPRIDAPMHLPSQEIVPMIRGARPKPEIGAPTSQPTQPLRVVSLDTASTGDIESMGCEDTADDGEA